jgi:hypothetical protein
LHHDLSTDRAAAAAAAVPPLGLLPVPHRARVTRALIAHHEELGGGASGIFREQLWFHRTRTSRPIPKGATTNIYIANAQLEAGTSASSYIPIGATPATRVADDIEEVGTIYPMSMSDALDGVTNNHIGFPINGAETAAMPILQIEASPGTLD